MPSRSSYKLKIFLPADLLQNITTIEQKTLLLGDISRYCAIYKVDEINIYDIPDSWKEKGFELTLIEDVLNYQMTPQYLRKYRFERRRTLSGVGLLHPLNTPNHPVEKENLDILLDKDNIMYRQGVVVRRAGKVASIDIGLHDPVEMQMRSPLKEGQLIDVKITRKDGRIEVVPEERDNIPLYWGYVVNVLDAPVPDILKMIKPSDITIATSRRGMNYRKFLQEKARISSDQRKAISIFFGTRSEGLVQLFPSQEAFHSSFDHVINCFDAPGTKTVRLEEAIPVSLAITGLLFDEEI
jgi:predicted SPOUT superfamily RNA methylase MTH1